MTDLPTGVVTFLFTDVEGSTRLWAEERAEVRGTKRRHGTTCLRVAREGEERPPPDDRSTRVSGHL